jgi:hypothetical protein
LVVILVLGALAAAILFRPESPASWRVEADTLTVSDARGRQLWQHRFGAPLDEDFYGGRAPYRHQTRPHFDDLDGDGRPELLFLAIAAGSPGAAAEGFYCFNPDGSLRFSVIGTTALRTAMRFGRQSFPPPFQPFKFVVDADSTGEKTILLNSHDVLWFPGVVQRYTRDGRLLGEYWNNGKIWTMRPMRLGDRRLVFVGATNNEHRAAGLAVLDADALSGFAPSTNPDYRCDTCPAGSPVAYFVFPRMEISRTVDARPYVWDVSHDDSGGIIVKVLQSAEPFQPGGPPGMPAFAIYRFDQRFNLREAVIADDYRTLHAHFELLGRLQHPLGAGDDTELLPVLKWDGGAFAPVQVRR